MAANKIVTASGIFPHKKILSGTIKSQMALPGDNLTVDVMNATIDGSEDVGTKFLPKSSSGLTTLDKKTLYVLPVIRIFVSDLSGYAYGEEVMYYHNDKLIGKYYMSSVRRVTKFTFEISCISAVGLLDNNIHYGGIYNGTPMSTILSSIIGGTVPYALDPRFQNLPVYGWLPIATRRENLQQLLFAEGASLRKDANGNLSITAITNDSPSDINNDRLFANGTISLSSQATRADVSEHAYIKYDTDEVITLFEGTVIPSSITTPNGDTVVGVLIKFDDPMHSLAVTGASILESNVNYAVLGQSGNAKLTGKKYTHTIRVVTKNKPLSKTRSLADVSDNVVTVKNATLVSVANSENIADRMIAYYGNVKEISVDVVVGTERPGDSIAFEDPFGDRNAGFISRFDMRMSNMLKASASLISGYIPPNIGNNYSKFVVLSSSTNWTVPEGVKRIRVVLIGGGFGGHSGGAGESGKGTTQVTMSEGVRRAVGYATGISGPGGQPGPGGIGGKIYEETIDVDPLSVVPVVVGPGGLGGSPSYSPNTFNSGNIGGDSKFGPLSSANGSVRPEGYTNIFNGALYATTGRKNGIQGGRGSGTLVEDGPIVQGGKVTFNGTVYSPGAEAAQIEDWKGNYISVSYGGLGGGPAAGQNGNGGYTGSVSATSSKIETTGGPGGYGADATAIPPASATLGAGGDGGHGGGGGGASGLCRSEVRTSGSTVLIAHQPSPARGGAGGRGGPGGQGCVIIYY